MHTHEDEHIHAFLHSTHILVHFVYTTVGVCQTSYICMRYMYIEIAGLSGPSVTFLCMYTHIMSLYVNTRAQLQFAELSPCR